MFFSILVAVLCFSSGAFAAPGSQRYTDIIFTILKEHDPLFVEKIEGNLPTLNYTFYNTSIVSYKNCEVKNYIVNEDETASQVELHCSTLTLEGDYDINGRLLDLNVKGHGAYSIITGKYIVTINHDLTRIQGKDGKTYLEIKEFEIKCDNLSPNKYNFKNLFNDQKELDAADKLINEKWKEASSIVELPAWTAIIGKVIFYLNEYFNDLPIENIIFS